MGNIQLQAKDKPEMWPVVLTGGGGGGQGMGQGMS